MRRTTKRAVAVGCAGAFGWVAVSMATARGQTIDVERPRTLIVGSPTVHSTMPGSNATETGVSPTRLPSTSLRTAWRASLGISVDRPPVLDSRGIIYVSGERGDVVAVSPTGEELWRLATGFAQPGPSTALSDDTVVFVDVNGEAIAVRNRSVRWPTRFARGDLARPTPLPLDDGGVIVASGDEIAALDAEGHERAGLVLAEPASALFATAPAQVAIATATGTIWTWTPGAMDPVRVATFGAAIDASAVLGPGHVLFAVTANGARLMTADLLHGISALWASSNGSVWLGPPAVRGETVSLLAVTTAGEVALAFDGSGREVGQAWIGSTSITVADGGVALRGPVPRVPPLVDSEGALAFAAGDGSLGVVSGLGSSQPTVERIPDVCPTPPGTRLPGEASVVGVTPLRPGAFLAMCRSGTLLAIRGGQDGQGGQEQPSGGTRK